MKVLHSSRIPTFFLNVCSLTQGSGYDQWCSVFNPGIRLFWTFWWGLTQRDLSNSLPYFAMTYCKSWCWLIFNCFWLTATLLELTCSYLASVQAGFKVLVYDVRSTWILSISHMVNLFDSWGNSDGILCPLQVFGAYSKNISCLWGNNNHKICCCFTIQEHLEVGHLHHYPLHQKPHSSNHLEEFGIVLGKLQIDSFGFSWGGCSE